MVKTERFILALLVPLLLVVVIVVSLKNSASIKALVWHGLYTDATSYEPGDTIQIYSSAPDVDTVFRLVRLDADWTEITRTQVLNVGPQSSHVGSFIEYPDVTMSGRTAFTLEGWLHPTILGSSALTDTVVVAGQIGLTESAAGIVILSDGRLAGYISDTPTTDPAKLAIAPAPASFENWLDTWHHLALTYDGIQMMLYIDGVLAAQRAQTGAVASVTSPFRLGARSEAPGDLTGVVDGRLDNWTLWPTALNSTQIETRRDRGLTEADPAPDLNVVDLYLNFEGNYPNVDDLSHNAYTGTLFNHGNPGVAGIISDTSVITANTGHAIRLNHDQIVDANWQMTAEIAIPPGTPSGMYAIQALPGPDYAATQTGAQLSARVVAIRPAANGPHAPIAVVLPTNTWNAYTSWPGTVPTFGAIDKVVYGPDAVTQRSRYPGGELTESGGNNSAYGFMGDDVSLSYFHGWKRPSAQASPIVTDTITGDYNVRAPNSMYLVQWLDAMGFAYDVFSDDDLDTGLITAADYRVLIPNSHHEYWSDGMVAALTQFLDEGGSVVAPAGNMFTWRVVYGEDRVIEVRKWRQAPVLGLADVQSGIDGLFTGGWQGAAICNDVNGNYYEHAPYKALGVMNHATKPCDGRPFCYGQWATRNADHWLWQGSGLINDDLFGNGRLTPTLTPTYALGHEMDTWVEGMPLPGLAPGQEAVILGEGMALRPGEANNLPKGRLRPTGHPTDPPPPTECQDVINITPPPKEFLAEAGTILYFPHVGGGHVLAIGASATPWALASDAALSGLMERALACFANDEGCGYDTYLPLVIGDS